MPTPPEPSSTPDLRSRSVAQADPRLLEVRDLTVGFDGPGGCVRVVEGVSLAVRAGRTTCLVGESGSGKTVTVLAALGLLAPPRARIESGQLLFRADVEESTVNLSRPDQRRMQSLRGRHIGLVFQEPGSSLNPVRRIGTQLAEVVRLHSGAGGRSALIRAADLLREVGLADPPGILRAWPHQLSGGMAQRVAVALALAGDPQVLIADEPTSALDAISQAGLLDLLCALQQHRGVGVLLITHDFGVVARMADEVVVMYAGQIVERASGTDLLARPRHPYTIDLLACTRREPHAGRRPCIPGSAPEPGCRPTGCRFHPRCRLAARLAERGDRPTRTVPGVDGSVLAACVVGPVGDGRSPALVEIARDHWVACPEHAGASAET